MILRLVWPAALVAVLSLDNSVRAGRITPDPLIRQFADGYGVVIARVERAALLPGQAVTYGTRYGVRFVATEIVAAPVTGAAFPLETGTAFDLTFAVGYALDIEHAEPGHNLVEAGGFLAPGCSYLLSVRYNGESKSFAHAPGAGSPEALPVPLSGERRREIAQTRELATLPYDRRMVRCQEIFLDPGATSFLRMQARIELGKFIRIGGRTDAVSQRIGAEWQRLWREPPAAWGDSQVLALDALLYDADHDYDRSDSRIQGLLRRLTAPLPEMNRAEAAKTRSQFYGSLAQILHSRDSAEVGRVLAQELEDLRWPDHCHSYFALYLQPVFLTKKEPHPDWEPALRNCYVRTLSGGDLSVTLSALENLAKGVVPDRPVERRLTPDARLRNALDVAERTIKQWAAGVPKDSPGVPVVVRRLEAVRAAWRE